MEASLPAPPVKHTKPLGPHLNKVLGLKQIKPPGHPVHGHHDIRHTQNGWYST